MSIKITKILIVNKMKNTKFASIVMIISLTIFSCQKKDRLFSLGYNYKF